MLKRTIALITLVFFLFGCAAPIGTTHVFNVNKAKQLVTPLQNLNEGHDDPSLIYRSGARSNDDKGDVFAFYLTDAYLRYLPDLGGINELIVIVEFTEVVTGTDEDRVVKILGPYNNMADATTAPFLNKLIYGPKRMTSDILSVDIKVYEYDQGEKENTASMLDFIATAGQALGVADPVTSAEIQVAKEIAKSIVAMNQNDLILHADIDFIAGADYDWPANALARGTLLKAGEIVLIKQEACRVGTCYGYFSKGDDYWNPIAWAADGVMLIPTAAMRGLTDVPARTALQDLGFGVDGIYQNEANPSATNPNPVPITPDGFGLRTGTTLFKDKTWLRLSVVKGGNPSAWEARKALSEADKKIQQMMRSRAAWDSTQLEAAITALRDAEQKVKQTQTKEVSFKGNVFDDRIYLSAETGEHQLCFMLADGLTFSSASAERLFKLDTGLVALATVQPEPVVKNHNIGCVELLKLDAGDYQLELPYLKAGGLKLALQNIKSVVIPQPTGCLIAATDTTPQLARLTLQTSQDLLVKINVAQSSVEHSSKHENGNIIYQFAYQTGEIKLFSKIDGSKPINIRSVTSNCS